MLAWWAAVITLAEYHEGLHRVLRSSGKRILNRRGWRCFDRRASGRSVVATPRRNADGEILHNKSRDRVVGPRQKLLVFTM